MGELRVRATAVVVFAPAGNDAAALRALLENEGVDVFICSDAAAFYAALNEHAWCAIVTEEGLAHCTRDGLDAALRRQALWSDLPLLALADSADRQVDGGRLLSLARTGNITMIERPTSREVLLMSLRAAMRARRLQFSTRDHWAVLERHADELQAAVEARTLMLQQEVTDRRHAEQALAEARKLEALGRLTGGVAHDFNNILQVISGAESLLRMLPDAPPSERTVRLLESIRKASDHGAAVTQQLLAYARRQPLQSLALDLRAHLDKCVEMLLDSIGGQIRFQLSLDEALWPVVADPAQLDAAILNIVGNARDAMPQGGDVRISAHNIVLPDSTWPEMTGLSGEYVCLAISDEGVGMSAETARQAFEPFYTTKPVGKGTGLGLSQVYGFAIQSQGTAFIRREAIGTMIGIVLPRGANMPETVDKRPQASPEQRLDGLRILFVEDNMEVAESTSALLVGMGAAVTLVDNADTAIATDLASIDLVLSDVMMPGSMDGIGLVRWLAHNHPEIPVVLVSGYMLDPVRLQTLQVEFVRKPYEMRQLAETILRATRLSLGKT